MDRRKRAPATPETVSQEANNPDPTGVYQLLDARLASATDTKPTSYSLSGHEAEFAKLEGQRVEVSGTIVPPLGDNRPGQPAAADGAQRIRVSAVKKIEGRCSAATTVIVIAFGPEACGAGVAMSGCTARMPA